MNIDVIKKAAGIAGKLFDLGKLLMGAIHSGDAKRVEDILGNGSLESAIAKEHADALARAKFGGGA